MGWCSSGCDGVFFSRRRGGPAVRSCCCPWKGRGREWRAGVDEGDVGGVVLWRKEEMVESGDLGCVSVDKRNASNRLEGPCVRPKIPAPTMMQESRGGLG